MQKRKDTPDILSNLMNQPTQTEVKPVKQNTSIPESARKVKATYYLSQMTLDELEDAWHQLRKEASRENRGEISKSLIVDIALTIVLEDLKELGLQSPIASRMLHHNTSNTP